MRNLRPRDRRDAPRPAPAARRTAARCQAARRQAACRQAARRPAPAARRPDSLEGTAPPGGVEVLLGDASAWLARLCHHGPRADLVLLDAYDAAGAVPSHLQERRPHSLESLPPQGSAPSRSAALQRQPLHTADGRGVHTHDGPAARCAHRKPPSSSEWRRASIPAVSSWPTSGTAAAPRAHRPARLRGGCTRRW